MKRTPIRATDSAIQHIFRTRNKVFKKQLVDLLDLGEVRSQGKHRRQKGAKGGTTVSITARIVVLRCLDKVRISN